LRRRDAKPKNGKANKTGKGLVEDWAVPRGKPRQGKKKTNQMKRKPKSVISHRRRGLTIGPRGKRQEQKKVDSNERLFALNRKKKLKTKGTTQGDRGRARTKITEVSRTRQ